MYTRGDPRFTKYRQYKQSHTGIHVHLAACFPLIFHRNIQIVTANCVVYINVLVLLFFTVTRNVWLSHWQMCCHTQMLVVSQTVAPSHPNVGCLKDGCSVTPKCWLSQRRLHRHTQMLVVSQTVVVPSHQNVGCLTDTCTVTPICWLSHWHLHRHIKMLVASLTLAPAHQNVGCLTDTCTVTPKCWLSHWQLHRHIKRVVVSRTVALHSCEKVAQSPPDCLTEGRTALPGSTRLSHWGSHCTPRVHPIVSLRVALHSRGHPIVSLRVALHSRGPPDCLTEGRTALPGSPDCVWPGSSPSGIRATYGLGPRCSNVTEHATPSAQSPKTQGCMTSS